MSNFFVKLIKNPFVINLLLVIVVSCGVVYGVLAWLDSYTRHNQAVVVPDVKGMKLEDAAEFFGNNKLRYNVIDSVFSKDVAPGSIVELVPGVGSKVKEGRIDGFFLFSGIVARTRTAYAAGGYCEQGGQ